MLFSCEMFATKFNLWEVWFLIGRLICAPVNWNMLDKPWERSFGSMSLIAKLFNLLKIRIVNQIHANSIMSNFVEGMSPHFKFSCIIRSDFYSLFISLTFHYIHIYFEFIVGQAHQFSIYWTLNLAKVCECWLTGDGSTPFCKMLFGTNVWVCFNLLCFSTCVWCCLLFR